MNSEKKQGFKKSYINYIDILIAIINSFIIIFPLTIFYEKLELSIIGIFISCGSLTVTIYTFIRNNPLYLYYCYTLLFCGVLFLIPSTMINPILGILFLPEVCYIYNISKGKSQTSALSSYAKARFISKAGGIYGLNARRLNQQWDNINPELEIIKKQQREILETQYHSKEILISSLLLSVSLIVVFALFSINLVS